MGEYVCSSVRVRLGRLSEGARLAVWKHRSEQSQAFNLGVELALASVDRDDRVPSRFTAFKELTARRQSGQMPAEVNLTLQRGGVSAGVDRVAKWDRARRSNAATVAYWTKKVAAVGAGDDGGYEDAAEYCAGRLDRAVLRQRKHLERGTSRLFRSRKRWERNPGRGPACVWLERVRIQDMTVRFPGGLCLPLAGQWGPPPGWEFTGSAQLVDATRRVTRRTEPCHRRYALHVQLRNPAPTPPDPTDPEQIVGVDAGVAINIATSDGRALDLTPTPDLDEQIRQVSRVRSGRVRGSRRWNRASRQLRRLYARRRGVVDNSMRHIAKQVATTPGIAAVGMEATNNRGMVASAKGTTTHPGVNVAAKRGLNRSLHRARYAGIRRAIARSCQLADRMVIPVHPAGTSTHCHKCGTEGTRESQAVFSCSNQDCGWVGNADYNAAHNTRTRAWETIQHRRQGMSSSDGRCGETVAARPRPSQTNTNAKPAQKAAS